MNKIEASEQLTIACIGAGYVGSLSMTVLAYNNPNIKFLVCDKNEEVIQKWSTGEPLFFEPKFEDYLKNVIQNNLVFSKDIDYCIRKADVIYISVDTPSIDTSGLSLVGKPANMKNFDAAVTNLGSILAIEANPKHKVIVEKSTVPVGTSKRIHGIIQEAFKNAGNLTPIDEMVTILSIPEFLAEGTAIDNLFNPDRVLIGAPETPNGKKATELVMDMYKSFIPKEKILTMKCASSELSKMLANAMLGQRISSMNSISALCEETDACILEVKQGVSSDNRIGKYHLNPSIGFGGSCFKKDIQSLVYICERNGLDCVAKYWNSVIEINEFQKHRLSKKIIDKLEIDGVLEKKVALLGISYKKNTSDTRETPTAFVVDFLLNRGVTINLYDPEVKKEQFTFEMIMQGFWKEGDAERYYDSGLLKWCDSINESATNTYALVILTEWNQFKECDYSIIMSLMKGSHRIFDYKCILDIEELTNMGYKVCRVGLKSL